MDRFVHDRLPPKELWPELDFSTLPELAAYPERLNCAVELLDRAVAGGDGGGGFADRPVLHFGEVVWTYRDLLDRADRIARVLVDDLGLEPGNRVLLRAPNNPMLVACWFGVVKAGGVVVATMPLLRGKEIATLIERADIRHGLCDRQLDADWEAARALEPRLEHVRYFSADGSGDDELERAMAGKAPGFGGVDTAGDDPVLIAFTSGTTGKPKGTVHFHRDVLAICDTFPRHLIHVRPDDVFVGSPPLAFTFGLGALVLFPMRYGASTVMVERFGPTTMLEVVERYRCTGTYTSPTGYRAMAPHVKDFDVASLRVSVSAGEHLPAATFELWERATGVKIVDGIGATEMLHIFISAAGDDIRPGSTGKAIPGYRARLVDADGQPVEPGPDGVAQGWLAVQGPTGCRYLDDVERQRGYVKDGWNLTGDIYRRDADGYFWYVARADDMIISSGYNISGPEVENSLLGHEAVAECAVVGDPDPDRGQVVKAFVVLRDGFAAGDAMVEALQNHVKGDIAPYKYPRRIDFVRELPKTQTGKLQRFRLREG